jgi:hypothetical protein
MKFWLPEALDLSEVRHPLPLENKRIAMPW